MKKFTKEELIEYATFCWHETLQANHALLIVKQIGKLGKKYEVEMNISPAFYITISNALVNSTMLQLAKLYDTNQSSVQIGTLMNQIKANLDIFPQYRTVLGTDNASSFEIPLYPQKKFQELSSRKRVLKNVIENLRNIRNKIYAHNDAITLNSKEEVLKDYPVSYGDIEQLITFSFDVCDFVLVQLTGVYTKREAVNINDLEGSLIYIRLGMKYKDVEVDRDILEFQKKLTEMGI